MKMMLVMGGKVFVAVVVLNQMIVLLYKTAPGRCQDRVRWAEQRVHGRGVAFIRSHCGTRGRDV